MKNARAIRRALLTWFDEEARDLPWRKTKDPYRIWLSEIMLQQTRVAQGLPYYERFLAALPSVEALAAASEDEVLKLWEGLGYYTRARNLHRAAKKIVEEYGGRFPEKAELLQLLPGIGRYTANAVASIAFGEAAAVVDGNVKRVLTRLYDCDVCIDETGGGRRIQEMAEALLPRDRPGDFNQAVMELGARICTPKNPDCAGCPVRRWCEALRMETVAERPVRRKKGPVPHHEMVAAVIARDGAFLIGRRPSEGLLGGLWEFPAGRVPPGESHQQALARVCAENLGIAAIRPGGLVTTVRHAYTHFRITMHVYRCHLEKGDPAPVQHAELRWVAPDDFDGYAFPKANHKFLDLIRGMA
jgi:A/G-specific adenine glycosylase